MVTITYTGKNIHVSLDMIFQHRAAFEAITQTPPESDARKEAVAIFAWTYKRAVEMASR